MNLSLNSIGDAGAKCVLTTAAVSMTRLVVLDLSNNKISSQALQDLPVDMLHGLTRLSSLSLASNVLHVLKHNFEMFRGLVSLDISRNVLEELPSAVRFCSLLQRLDCSRNKLRKVASEFCELFRLVVLDVSSNELVQLPGDFSRLSNLHMLKASDNKLESLPRMPLSLLSLALDSNQLVELPPQIGDLSGLETLNLAKNKLSNLPPTLARTALRQSRGLVVVGNPLSCIPDLVRESPDEILGFLEDVHEGVDQVLFIRVMVMGDEGAGKTSLVRCLHDPDISIKALLRQPRLPDTGGSTLGVEVAAKNDTTCRALGAQVSMQFWDLAGQACYLVGHSLLMSDRVLPLYVLDASAPQHSSIEKALKWLDTLMLALPPVPHTPDSTGSGTAESDVWPGKPRRLSSASSKSGREQEISLPRFADMPPRPSLDGSEVPHDLECDSSSPSLFSPSPTSPTIQPESGYREEGASSRIEPTGASAADSGVGGGGRGSWVVSVVIIGTRIEPGSCDREEAISKMQAVSQAMVDRTMKLHGRRLKVRSMLGVSHATRECFDARSHKDCKASGELNFKQVLKRIAEAAIGVLYTDRQYPRALVPIAYTKLRSALHMYGTKPVLEFEFVSKLAQQHAGITAEDKLHRALAMLQCWGVLVYFRDSPQLKHTVLQARWCSSLIYTLFMCAHFASAKQRLNHAPATSPIGAQSLREMEEALAAKVDMEYLAASDPGGSLLLRGIVTRGAVQAIFSKLASAAGLPSTDLCVSLLEHVRILYRVQDDSFVVPSLFQHSLPARIRSIIRSTCNSSNALKWSTSREYRFNILPYKFASALTVSVCASADLRSGAGSVVTWAEGVWLQAHDGTAVLVDTQQAAGIIAVKTIEVLPRDAVAPNERPLNGDAAEGAKASPGGGAQPLRWVSKMQSEIETLLARFPGVSAETWIRCPHRGCCEYLPFQRICGGGSCKGWENMSAVWDGWTGGSEARRGDTAMCGHVPDTHSFPVSVWVHGIPRPSVTCARGGANVMTARPIGVNEAGRVDSVAGSVTESERPLCLRPLSQLQTDGPMMVKGTGEGEEHQADGLSLVSEIETRDGGEFAEMYKDWQGGAKDWQIEGYELAVETAKETQDLALYMKNPIIMGDDNADLQNSLVMQAITACCGSPDEVEGVHGFIVEVLHEAEEWAPVCKAVFGVIGACLVASGRGMANDVERKLFYERMVSLGRTLMQVRETFAHNAPPQMEGLLMTLKTALGWIETFDGRGWFMKALKSASDKEALQNFNHAITAHVSDMSLSLQATAHRDEHMVLREMAGALMHEIHDIKRVAVQQLRANSQPLRKVQSADSDKGSCRGEDNGAALSLQGVHVDESSRASSAEDRTVLLEKRLQEVSLQQAEQTRLLQQFLQRLPDPALQPSAGGGTQAGGDLSGVHCANASVCGEEFGVDIGCGDRVTEPKPSVEAGASPVTSPGLKPRSLNRSSRPRSRIVGDDQDAAQDGAGCGDAKSDGREAGAALRAAPSSSAEPSSSIPSSFSPLPPAPLVLPVSSHKCTVSRLQSAVVLNPGLPPQPLGAPASPGCATQENPSSPPEELFGKQ